MAQKENAIFKNVTWVTVIMLLSKVLGFLRQAMIAFSYGSDEMTDIYFTSSEFMLGISFAFTEALTMGLVTIYIQTRQKKGFGAANRVANRVMSMYLMFSIALVTLLVIFAPFLARILCPTYTGSSLRLLTQYLRLFSLTILFAAFQSNFSAVLNANDSYIPGKLYGVIVNPIIILCMMLFGAKIGLYALVIGFVIANLIQIVLLAVCCRRVFRFRPLTPFGSKAVARILRLSVPLLLSNILVQCNQIVDKVICSVIGTGTVSAYAYANTLEQFVTASFSVSVGLILFSRFSECVAQNDLKKMTHALTHSVSLVLLILVPVALVAVFASYDVVAVVYQRGNFNANDTMHTAVALIGLCLGIPLSAVNELYLRAHYSLLNTKKPLYISLCGVVLNGVLSLCLAQFWGVFGVAFATSVSRVLTVILLHRSIRKYLPSYRFLHMRSELLRILFATLAAAIVLTPVLFLPIRHGFWLFLLKTILGLCTYEGVLLLTKSKGNTELYQMILHMLPHRKKTAVGTPSNLDKDMITPPAQTNRSQDHNNDEET